MRLKRKIDDYLIEWKNNKNRLPLIVKGARQIGKTESIRNFGLNNYLIIKLFNNKTYFKEKLEIGFYITINCK